MRTYYILLFMLSMFGCRKHRSELGKLPEATQNGAGTFGCLVNGNSFRPKGDPFGGPILSASYQHLNTPYSKGYYFSLSAKNSNADGVTALYINTDSLPIQQGQTILLQAPGKKAAASAGYYVGMISTSAEYLTNASVTGELKITRFDEANQIVSGTFWFDAQNSTGAKVQVREGRFDLIYTL